MDKHNRPSAAASERSQPRRYAVEKQGSSAGYAGRFGSSADAGSQRPTGSYRSQPSGSYRSRIGYEPDRRAASTRSGGDSYTRRPQSQPAMPEQPSSARPGRRSRNKRGEGKRGLRLGIFAVLAVLVVIALLLILGGGRQTLHQLPTVERAALLQEAERAV